MPQDEKKEFDSRWSIDQILDSSPITVVVPAGTDTDLYVFSSFSQTPVFEVQFQPTGTNNWYQTGANSTNAAVSGLFTFTAWATGNTIRCNSSIAGVARVYIWSEILNV